MKDKVLTDRKLVLEKIPGKGGWTYVVLDDIKKPKGKGFAWTKVKGTIDGYKIAQYHLMSMGEGRLFLPIRGEIRKAIKKREGDTVHIILYPDTDPVPVPVELQLCLDSEPEAGHFFNTLTEGQQLAYIKWINAAKTEDTKVKRLTKTIENMLAGKKYYQEI